MEKEGPQACIFFNFNPPFPLEDGQSRKLHIFTRKNFSHWAIEISENQVSISFLLSGKDTITF